MHWQDTAGGPSKAHTWKFHTFPMAGEGNHKEAAGITAWQIIESPVLGPNTSLTKGSKDEAARHDRPAWRRECTRLRGEGTGGTAAPASWDRSVEMGLRGIWPRRGTGEEERRHKWTKVYSECRKHLARCRLRQNTSPSSKLPQISSPWPWQRWEEKAEGEIIRMLTLVWITQHFLRFMIWLSALHADSPRDLLFLSLNARICIYFLRFQDKRKTSKGKYSNHNDWTSPYTF